MLALSGQVVMSLTTAKIHLPQVSLPCRVTGMTPCIAHCIPGSGPQGDTKTAWNKAPQAACNRIFFEGRLTGPHRRMT